MENLTSITGKLLFFVYRLSEEKKVSSRQKGMLKDLIVANNKDVLAAFEVYEREGTELTLTSDLLRLLRAERENQALQSSSQDSYKARRGGPIMVSIPKRSIQKLPGMDGRL